MNLSDLHFIPAWPPVIGPLAWVAVLLLAAIVAGEAVRRWLRVSRVIGYLLVGAVLGPHAAGLLDTGTLDKLRVFVDIAVGLLLFELGQRVDLGWLRRNPWLLAASLLEAALTLAAVFALMTLFGARPVTATAAALAFFGLAGERAAEGAPVAPGRGLEPPRARGPGGGHRGFGRSPPPRRRSRR